MTSGNIALMMLVYGFPYILSIPSIWDMAMNAAKNQLLDHDVLVQNPDAIEKAASLDYLCV